MAAHLPGDDGASFERCGLDHPVGEALVADLYGPFSTARIGYAAVALSSCLVAADPLDGDALLAEELRLRSAGDLSVSNARSVGLVCARCALRPAVGDEALSILLDGAGAADDLPHALTVFLDGPCAAVDDGDALP